MDKKTDDMRNGLRYLYQSNAMFYRAVHASCQEFNMNIHPQHRVSPSVYLELHMNAIPDFILAVVSTQAMMINDLLRDKEDRMMIELNQEKSKDLKL